MLDKLSLLIDPKVLLVSYPAAQLVGCRRRQRESARFVVGALADCRATPVGVLALGY